MPIYTLRKKSTDEVFDVNIKFDDLAQMLEDDDIERVLSTPHFAGNTVSNLRRAGSEWQDHLNRIKKGSGSGNTIKT
jgi:phosphoglycerate dehydrogenase-like enzyme